MFIIVLLCVAAGAGTWRYWPRGNASNIGPATAKAVRRDLASTVLATGAIKPQVGAEVKVGSRISGAVKRLPANIGSFVRKGQVIAELDDREALSQVDQARANLAAARTRLGELEAGYPAQVVQSATDVEQANLASARSRLVQARTAVGTVPVEVAAQIEQAKTAVDQAEANRDNAKARLDRVQGLLAQGFIAKQDEDTARTEYAAAAAQVRHAQAVLEAARANASQTEVKRQDLAQAQEAVRQAESALHMARANTVQVRVKEQAIRTTRAQVMQAEAALRYAETQDSYTRIVSPIAGVIASVPTQEGETIAAGLQAPTFVTIIDLSKLQVDTFVDEVDIGKVKPGQKAIFTVDSFPAREFEGKVVAIYPKAVIQENVVDYDVVVRISDKYDGLLRPEMTSSVTIFLEAKANVLTVPVKALKREGGKSVVYVLANGQPRAKEVKVGWRDSQWVEILSGLEEGQTVLLEAPPAGPSK